MRDFVHLHLHTDFSLLESAIQLKPLAKHLNRLNQKACAITDLGNMYGAVTFYNSMKSEGIHPIIGSEAFLTFGSRFDKGATLQTGERPYYNIVLLAKDFEGYQNLTYLSSKAFTEGFHYKPRIDIDLLAEKSKGLIALSSGFKGAIWHYLQQDNFDEAVKKAKLFEDIFGKGNYFIEVQDHGLDEEKNIRKSLLKLSKATEIPLVATNEAFYLNADDAQAQEVLLCIGEGRTLNDSSRTVLGSSEFYVRSSEEMWRLFGDELPDSLNKTLEIAEKCDFKIASGDLTLPSFPIPQDSGCNTTEAYFEKVIMDGFAVRQKTVWDKLAANGTLKYPIEDYHLRIKREIQTIINMGFPGYFLIVWEFIQYAKSKDIPVGPGRGSAAGSLVAYCMEITDVDPIQYDLLFERFLNPERISMPDIDIDFCVRGRADVINHVTEFYGRDSVCQIITFGTMASKAAIKDVGRALDMPYAEVEKIAKLIPPPVRGRNVSITQAIEQVPELKQGMETNAATKKLVDLAMRLEGCSRHSSVHAAGVVISPKPLHEIVPITYSSKNELTSQYTMNDLEKVGLLKMDFLALTTLTTISDCLKSLKQKLDVEIDWSLISLEDEATMKLFADGKTEAIFQFESSGMQEICRRLKPKELEDLAALNALYRPGPLDGGMVDDFINRHRGDKKVEYIVPEMESILSNTYGVLVYQEQIMQLAQNLAGYSLGEADLMRRAMGKKKREEMDLHEEKFVRGAIDRKINKAKAVEIFRLMAQFADYGFNRSHSVAYAYLAFQTAYLKAHYPAYFYASVLSSEAQDTAKIYKYSNELKQLSVKLLPPDVNESDGGFTPLNDSVRFGLTAIKGLGTTAVEAIIEARKSGKFTSLYDFVSRIHQGSINRRGLESLISSGAFDSIMPTDFTVNLWRARLFAGIDGSLSHAQRTWNDRLNGQSLLFGAQETIESSNASDELPEVEAWTQQKLTQEEKSAVGFYLSNHPLDNFVELLSDLKIKDIADYSDVQSGERISIAGIISGFQVKYSKKGNRFAIFRFEDQSNGVKCLVWSEAYGKISGLLENDRMLILTGKVETSEAQEFTLFVDEAESLDDALAARATKLFVSVVENESKGVNFDDIFDSLSRNAGRNQAACDVYFDFTTLQNVKVRFLSQLRVQGSKSIENDLKSKGYDVNWELN
jgi:DNA polymerase III subunit alpha